MHFTVIGAGAIGGTIGAHLVRAGHDVLFVDADTKHVDAIDHSGLTIEGKDTFHVRAPAVTVAGLADALRGRPPEVVLLAVKAMHTTPALEPVVPLLGTQSFVVSMQNGLENTQLTSNIWGYLWGKLGYASMLFATAVVDETMADVLADPVYRPLLANLAGEVVRVADGEGVRSEGFDGYDPNAMRFAHPRDWDGIERSLDRLADFNRRSLKQKSGIWRDLAVRHRRTEVDDQIGLVVAAARHRGFAVPLNDHLVETIHDLESGRRPMAAGNLESLRRLSEEMYQ